MDTLNIEQERREFEEAFAGSVEDYDLMFLERNSEGDYAFQSERSAWQMWLFAKQAALDKAATAPQGQPAKAVVPEGWKLVPVRPTRAMLIAADYCRFEGEYEWAAMLAAAPTAPALPATDTASADINAEEVRDAALEEAATTCEMQDRVGYEWVRDSVWDNVLKRGASAIRSLKTGVKT
ncbi:hypothetical protein RGU70_13780 [Herbaspirillum sp. RTI4]|uniref:hypothetical protein n=1 Tax=Herbaspirillum sp. RTI4 TaxID=3048640 RepID=UPI002AB5C722|nr:hypothetical protein [Herbaspirillum sp. RTI4]MDY7579384.1 hypothetical protein [Herbaspirillum sp. RTI4]MEA9980298.1 hypothetical protein [Herbaspirillum sp. RTI4]